MTPVFVKMLDRWRATVRSLNDSVVAMSLFERPEATSRSTSASRSREPDGQRGRAQELVDGAGVERGAEMVEDRLGSGERGDSSVVVAGDAARLAEQEAGGGDLVGDVELLPPLERASQHAARRAGVAGRERQTSLRGRGLSEQSGALEVRCDRRQLGHRLVRRVEVVARDRDLHARRKQPRAGESVPRLVIERLRDDRRRGGALALRQPHEREPGLGTTRERFGLAERAARRPPSRRTDGGARRARHTRPTRAPGSCRGALHMRA